MFGQFKIIFLEYDFRTKLYLHVTPDLIQGKNLGTD